MTDAVCGAGVGLVLTRLLCDAEKTAGPSREAAGDETTRAGSIEIIDSIYKKIALMYNAIRRKH